MTSLTETILKEYQIRKSKKQKQAFRDWLIPKLEEKGYAVSVEEGSMGSRNIVVTGAVREYHRLLVTGENFTEFSQIVTGDQTLDTVFIDAEHIVARVEDNLEFDTFCVAQVDRDGTELSRTGEYGGKFGYIELMTNSPLANLPGVSGAVAPRSLIVRGGVYAAGGAFFATRS